MYTVVVIFYLIDLTDCEVFVFPGPKDTSWGHYIYFADFEKIWGNQNKSINHTAGVSSHKEAEQTLEMISTNHFKEIPLLYWIPGSLHSCSQLLTC